MLTTHLQIYFLILTPSFFFLSSRVRVSHCFDLSPRQGHRVTQASQTFKIL